jgi:hypothetical protein
MKRRNRKSQQKRKAHHRKPSRTRLSPPIKTTDPRIARGLGLMRREELSASQAARRERMKLRTFREGAGRFLYRSGPGKPWKARSEDQLAFSMEVLTPKGRVSVIIRDSRERKLLHEYENALRRFRGPEEGAEEELKRFEGMTVGGYELITDAKLLIELEEGDQLDFESLYSPFRGQS